MHFLFLFSVYATRGYKSSMGNPLSLLSPHVNDNGRNDFYKFSGDYIVSTRSFSNFVQIGYSSPETSGRIQTKDPIQKRNFKIDITFLLEKSGEGYGFFISSPLHKGDFYGRDSLYKGFGIILNTSSTPFLQYYESNKKVGKKVNLPKSTIGYRIVLQNEGNKFSASLFVSTNETLIYKGTSKMKPEYVFGVSGSSGSGEGVLKVTHIFGSDIPKASKSAPGEHPPKSNKMVLFIGVVGIALLVWYLYKKQVTEEKSFMNKR